MEKEIIAGYNDRGLLQALIYRGNYVSLVGNSSAELKKDLQSKDKLYPGIYASYYEIMKKLYEVSQLLKSNRKDDAIALKKEVSLVYQDVSIDELKRMVIDKSDSNVHYYELCLCHNSCGVRDNIFNAIVHSVKSEVITKNVFFFIISEEEVDYDYYEPFPIIGELRDGVMYDVVTNEVIEKNLNKELCDGLSYYTRREISKDQVKNNLEKLSKEDIKRYRDASDNLKKKLYRMYQEVRVQR